MAWHEHSPEDRRHDLHSVMKCVRFANIDSYYFCDRIQCSDALRECDELSELFNTVRAYHMLPNRRSEVLMFSLDHLVNMSVHAMQRAL